MQLFQKISTVSQVTLTLVTFAAFTLGFVSSSQAFYTVLETGEVLRPSTYRLSLAPQFIFNRFDGVNAIATIDVPVNDSQSIRGLFGTGKVDFQIGGFYKYVPFPNTAKQPAIGGSAGLVVAKIKDITTVNIRLTPLASKKIPLDMGDLIPYVALPIGITTLSGGTGTDKTSLFPVQVTGGAEMQFLDMPHWAFQAELGLNINDAFSYVALAAVYQFDYRPSAK
jgi:hypothetical protein